MTEPTDRQTAISDALAHATHPIHESWRDRIDTLVEGLRERGYTIRSGPNINEAALIELVANAMCAGFLRIIEQARDGEVDPQALMIDALGDFPAEFLHNHPSLVEALTADPPK